MIFKRPYVSESGENGSAHLLFRSPGRESFKSRTCVGVPGDDGPEMSIQ